VCTVSAINDYFNRGPGINAPWTQPAMNEYKEILARLAKLDEMLQQRDCEDPAKAAWMREVEARLAELEK
jgi:hypothetical protein